MDVVWATYSDAGGRDSNQDRVGAFTAECGARVFVLCDGLGGHRGGEVAAAAAVGAVQERARHPVDATDTWVRDTLLHCHNHVCQAAANHELLGMRTTAVLLVLKSDAVAWGHVGDSRLYCLHDGDVVEQTKDHSVVQMLVDAGDIDVSDIIGHPDRSTLLRSLGDPDGAPKSSVKTGCLPQEGNAQFLLCSDGFWELVSELEIADAVSSLAPANASDIFQEMLANRVTDGADNFSFIIVDIRTTFTAA